MTEHNFPVLKCRLAYELSEFIIIYELVYNMGLDILILIIISFTRDNNTEFPRWDSTV